MPNSSVGCGPHAAAHGAPQCLERKSVSLSFKTLVVRLFSDSFVSKKLGFVTVSLCLCAFAISNSSSPSLKMSSTRSFPPGIHAPSLTWFKNDANQELDWDLQKKHIEFLIGSGLDGGMRAIFVVFGQLLT